MTSYKTWSICYLSHGECHILPSTRGFTNIFWLKKHAQEHIDVWNEIRDSAGRERNSYYILKTEFTVNLANKLLRSGQSVEDCPYGIG